MLIIVASIFLAFFLAKSGLIDGIIMAISGYYLIAAFVAGLFFTSSFTTAPAIVFLAKLSLVFPPFIVIFVGAFGSLLGDLIIFTFIKDRLAEDLVYVLSKSKIGRITHFLQYHSVRWIGAIVGAIIIASPLPDEFGIALMGITRISFIRFCIFSFTSNVIGIFLIVLFARSL